jgi:Glyoxalase/Bleomycin resistance protein/Dioxygenase superfamily
MKIARIILFTPRIEAMTHFHAEVLGLAQITDEPGCKEFAAGQVNIALHSGPASPGRKGPKIVFHVKDVAAARDLLVARGARFGKVRQGEFCTAIRCNCRTAERARPAAVIMRSHPWI